MVMNPHEKAQKISKAMKEKHKDKDYAEKQKAHLREENKKLWNDPVHKKKMSEKGKARYKKK